jgi:hypothetical protein
MNTRRNNKRPRKHGRKTRSRQKGGDNEEYYTEELVEAIELGDIDNVISTLEQGADLNLQWCKFHKKLNNNYTNNIKNK